MPNDGSILFGQLGRSPDEGLGQKIPAGSILLVSHEVRVRRVVLNPVDCRPKSAVGVPFPRALEHFVGVVKDLKTTHVDFGTAFASEGARTQTQSNTNSRLHKLSTEVTSQNKNLSPQRLSTTSLSLQRVYKSQNLSLQRVYNNSWPFEYLLNKTCTTKNNQKLQQSMA